MSLFKLALGMTPLIIGISTDVSATVSGTIEANIVGSINVSNTCDMSITGGEGGGLHIGTKNISDLADFGGLISPYQVFTTSISCLFPTAILIKYSSSLPLDTVNTDRLGLYKTTNNDIVAGYLSANIGTLSPTAGNVPFSYAAVGDLPFNNLSSASILTASSDNTAISGVSSDPRNAYTVINGTNNPVLSSTFSLPFNLGIWTLPKGTWAADISGQTLLLNGSVSVSLYTL